MKVFQIPYFLLLTAAVILASYGVVGITIWLLNCLERYHGNKNLW